jgi:hypothetical protein
LAFVRALAGQSKASPPDAEIISVIEALPEAQQMK